MQLLWTFTEEKFFCSNVSKIPKFIITYTLNYSLEMKKLWDHGKTIRL